MLCLSSLTAFGAEKGYTCGNLAYDNKNHTIFLKKDTGFTSVDEYLTFVKSEIMKNFPKKVALQFYEESKAKNDKDAYFNSLDAYKTQLDRMSKVDFAINFGSNEKGGIGNFITDLCKTAKEGENLEINKIFYTFIITAIKNEK